MFSSNYGFFCIQFWFFSFQTGIKKPPAEALRGTDFTFVAVFLQGNQNRKNAADRHQPKLYTLPFQSSFFQSIFSISSSVYTGIPRAFSRSASTPSPAVRRPEKEPS